MCGIAGVFNVKDAGPVNYESLCRMASMLKHRGPDEYGIYIDDKTGLASSRLKIIDLYGGTQPIHNEDETLWIVYNGEIFNYIELKDDLKKSHKFYTTTDTEVILHLYEEKGIDCLNDLNGEFAFAIYDLKKQELIIARDRFGIRPLFYTIHNGQFIFASEIKSIFACGSLPREIDPVALDQIFTFWTTIPGTSIFKNIFELPAAHFLRVSTEGPETKRYWEIPFNAANGNNNSRFDDFRDELYELLKDAVRIRLRSDVPVGCYISGGLDSSAIVSLLKNNFNNEVKTFGIGFEEESFDESHFQKDIAEYLKVNYSNTVVTNSEIGALFAEAIWYCEKPVLRTAPVPMLVLSKLVHLSGFKVVLTGEGADEVFGGYDIFKEAKARSFWAKRPESVFRPLLLRKIYPYLSVDKKLQPMLQQFFKNGINEPGNVFFSHLIRWNNTAKLKTFFSRATQEALKDYDCYDELKRSIPEDFSRWDYLSKAQYLEIILFLNNYLLSSQGDRMAMASSVETRLPYLDYRIIELMAKVPASWKIRGMQEKYILKKAVSNILPEKTIKRTKYPYRAPVSASLLQKSGECFDNPFNPEFFKNTELFDPDKVQKLTDKLLKTSKATELDNMAFAGILSTQHLYNHFINSDLISGQTPMNKSFAKKLFDRRGDYNHV